MSIVTSLLGGLTFGAIGSCNACDKTNNDNKTNKESEKMKIARKEQLLDEFEAAVLIGDMNLATKIKTELSKLSDVPISAKRTKEYTKLLKRMSKMKAELLDQKEAAILRGEDPPQGIDEEIAKSDTLSSMFQEVLGLPKTGIELPRETRREYASNLERLPQRYAVLLDIIEGAILRGEDPPANVNEEIEKLRELNSFYQEALGLEPEDIELPRETRREYASNLERLPQRYAVLLDIIEGAILRGEDPPANVNEEIEKLRELNSFYQEALGFVKSPKFKTLILK